jgi:predicted O-linked N-acetylglucosamine transferase (SPINDLY family)
LKADYADAYLNLGNALKDQGKLDDAVASYRRVLTLRPNYAQAHSNLLFCLNYRAGITQEEIYNESLQWADRFGEGISTADTLTYANSRRTDRRLRIGYVSPDFRVHSVAFFVEPVIRAHNRKRVEIFCYANVKKPDNVTRRLQAEADHWFSVLGMDHEAVAARIREDRIDILVDLAGHTSNNSLPVFAYKPSPVQVTWLGYPNTTGLETMDYRLTDAVADPEGEADRLHSEKLIRLEHGFLCYQPPASAPEAGSLPCREGGSITFGSFNNLTKVTPEVVKAWAGILHAVPDSRLLLKAKQFMDDETRERFREMFAREGITGERLEMHKKLPDPADHLGLYSRVDIGLDPFPYNGTTTTCEALWMGVPVVTLLGARHAGRVGASIMHRVGLEELVAHSMDEYIELARALALDRKRLQEMRFSLRGRLHESELMNSGQFTNHLEDVYCQIWRKYCNSKS